MASPATTLFVFTLLLTTALPTHSFPFSQYHSLLSVSHSLTTRVANLRASRGDYAGAARARGIAQKLESGLGFGFWKFMLRVSWDYVKNYSWRDTLSFDMFYAVGELNELLAALSELTQITSDSQRAAWIGRNYQNILRVSRSLFGRLLNVFRQSGPLRELVETLQKEVLEGSLLIDCLELGANDLKGMMQVLKDIASQYTSKSSGRTEL